MKTKMLEIRDHGTCIPAVAIKMESANEVEHKFLWRCGYPRDGSSITLLRLGDQRATNDPYEWPSITGDRRTMPAAHLYILEHWEELRDGSVVDVRVYTGEATEHCSPEIWI